ncbi:hypothetical protein I204_01403 [Kwoniella mangroviensis CBS 8886]|nr:hypothetical protein I204_01403 [Kwoniella mangroviensis CBS 8886]
MDYQYHQEGWGPLQQPFTTFPLYSSLRATDISDNEAIGSSTSFVHGDHQGFSQLPSYPFSTFPTIAPQTNSDINLYQPRYVPTLTEIPQTPVNFCNSALPPSISPRDIHIPRYNGLEVAIPDSSFLPDSAPSPLFTYSKKNDGQAMEADTDTESDSDSEYGFEPARQVSRSLLNDLTASNSPISSSRPQINGYADQPIVPEDQRTPGKSTPIPAEELPVEMSQIVLPALVNVPTISNNKKSLVGKRKRQSAFDRKKEDMITQTPGDKKPTSGGQVLLAKKAKPGRRPRPTKAAGTKKGSANGGKQKGKTVTVPLPASSSDSLSSYPQSSLPGQHATTRKANASSSLARSRTIDAGTLPPLSSPETGPKPKLRSRSKSKPTSTSKSRAKKKVVAKTMTVEPKSVSKTGKKLKEVSQLGEKDPSSPISSCPSSDASDSDGEDEDYRPSPSPAVGETEDQLDPDLPSPVNHKKKRSRSEEADDEEWGAIKKKGKREMDREPQMLIQEAGDIPVIERKLNKARNQLYHSGRQEQNVRAQSKYRNKIKARSDLVLEFAQEIFPKVRNTPAAKKMMKKLEELDHNFAEEKFGKL